MEKEKLKELVKSDKYISGIYNFCDRWCEKCVFTDKCLSYEMSKESYADKPEISDKKFWSDLENSFKMVKEMLSDYMKEHNISMPTDEETEQIEIEMKRIDDTIKANPLVLESRGYNKTTTNFLRENDYFVPEPTDEIEDETEIEKFKRLQDAIEIILYYKNMIYVKLSRALHSYYSDDDEEEYEGYEEDKLVYARITIVIIERSMAAWHHILENNNNQSDSIIDLLLQLNKIKLGIERLIPKVVDYKRPYFD